MQLITTAVECKVINKMPYKGKNFSSYINLFVHFSTILEGKGWMKFIFFVDTFGKFFEKKIQTPLLTFRCYWFFFIIHLFIYLFIYSWFRKNKIKREKEREKFSFLLIFDDPMEISIFLWDLRKDRYPLGKFGQPVWGKNME